jgi:hypothetical protein
MGVVRHRADLIDTLALHPWSLIPEPLSPERLECRFGSGRLNIAASMDGAPVTDLERTKAAQRFLEMAKGWPGA